MKRLGPIVLIVGMILLAVVAIGMALPQEHEVTRSARLKAPVPAVFAILSDVEKYPEWRSDVDRVTVLPDDGNGLRFQEHRGDDVVTYRVEESTPPSMMRVRIDDGSLPFGGTWTYILQPFDSGTSLTITEKGQISNPVFRVLAKFVFSPAETMERYLRDLERAEVSK